MATDIHPAMFIDFGGGSAIVAPPAAFNGRCSAAASAWRRKRAVSSTMCSRPKPKGSSGFRSKYVGRMLPI